MLKRLLISGSEVRVLHGPPIGSGTSESPECPISLFWPGRLPLEGAHRRRIVADLEKSAHGRGLAGAEMARARRRSAAIAARAGRT